MKNSKCPTCSKKHMIFSRPSSKDQNFPFTICPYCKSQYVPEILQKRIKNEYKEPSKTQILLCGLPVAIVGLVIIVVAIILNKPLFVALGGIVFSFYILLIAMSISLWKEILINSKKEYEIIKKNQTTVLKDSSNC